MTKLEIALTLLSGGTIDRYKESGNSMLPLIKSGQPVKLEPVKYVTLNVGDVVFCKVKGNYYTHKILKIKGFQYLIGNNRGHPNGWVTKNSIYGIVTEIYDK